MDLVKANVLIDEAEHACLADFGFLTIISDATNLASSTSPTQGGTHRWMSPELFDPESFDLKDSRLTKYSDRYALGMLIYEVLSGQVPFSRYHGYAVVVRILKGDRPERPQGVVGTWFTDDIWSILGRCWEPVPGDRPGIRDVLQCLEMVSGSWTPPSPQVLVSPPAKDPPERIIDSSVEEDTDESATSSPLQGVSSRPLGKHLKGYPNEITSKLLLMTFQLVVVMFRITLTLE